MEHQYGIIAQSKKVYNLRKFIQLEKVQVAGLRAITGGKKGTSHASLYYETKVEKLEARRKRQKLILLYKAIHGQAPETLRSLIPNRTHQRTQLKILQ